MHRALLIRVALATAAAFAASCSTSSTDRTRGIIADATSPKITSAASRAPFAPEKLAALDAAVARAIAARQLPGGVLWLEREGDVYGKAYGQRAVIPEVQPATVDTIYDIASLTKIVVTAPAILQLTERGQLDLDAPVARYLPAFVRGDDARKGRITVRHLLTHTSGLPAGIPRNPPWSGYETGIAHACSEKPVGEPGGAFLYSDINFILLGEIVRVVSRRSLDVYAQQEIFAPLAMKDTSFLPSPEKRSRIAPTESAGAPLEGVVHDPTSRLMGGVAGHAGVFSTTADLARFCRMILNGGQLDGARVLSPASVAEMTRVQIEGNDRRGLGWDIDSRYSAPRGRWFPAGESFGHTGWTGASLWIDPRARSFVIFLSNRVHPDGGGNVTPLRREIGTLAAEAIGRDHGAVLNGIDVLVREDFARLRGLKVGLITNQSGRDREGRLTIDLLHAAPDVELVALFSPEHGIRGNADENVGDSVDEKTRLPIYSLYGATPPRTPGQSQAEYDMAAIRARAPKAEQVRDLDALVFDIQDIGARFYTYSSTLGAALEVAGREGKKLIVLDRVNPIGGARFEGPVQTRAPSFIGFHPIPVRHGLTLGELARLLNSERRFGAELVVVPVENWTRATWLDETGLPWINPSPSMRSLTAATLYPGLCLLESTSISMGRGTIRPFEQVGAPFIDGGLLAAEMNAQGLPGVRFEAVRFTPEMAFYPGPAASLKYKDQPCGGVRPILTDRNRCNVVDVGIELALAVHRLYPGQFDVGQMGRLLGNDETLAAIARGESLAQIKARWAPGLQAFAIRRRAALIYAVDHATTAEVRR